MAMYFNLVAQCGYEENNAEEMAEHFRDSVLRFRNGLTTRCRCWIQQDLKGYWWAIATPLGASYGSCIEGDTYLLTSDEQYEQLRDLLYRQLLSAPPFLCASANWEIQDDYIFHQGNPMDEDYSFAEFDILCGDLWNDLQRPIEYSFFKEGYVIKEDFSRLF